ncbi:bifunctional phosphopantothenoylcysteine decarboxylase/phosphopantothenate--cysteine ligase CoaBC [Psychroflexus sp. ALD_RP9]|uniref:bifunctional phosphopantothenoylcysteine decarboxylase/phosphopantothenate--cysteine ligase CoaBC n=1 Tax=Psychroflexus sp. ALD_RP9 TaxID=2777186 RepID=UPI001A903AE3|nr:bifunctional phosphopantothenoylcysteine decarboxylase/phosphopantothenate--cysteine ligase CoaBC [Psychroflexus sp. ALD_RP9]QSS96789.1 bifunctional phosphopantothenoylcysteine decarboxylase/phosphopantothenate--cysteine ligase CoaBC [Psychroflexus sp. ALD_RP9]
MHLLSGKKILLGITGGIAAYKSIFLLRLLKKSGAHVKVVTTPKALDFVTPLTLATLSEFPVYHQLQDEDGNWTNHVELGLWADLMVIAPVTANTLAKMAHGNADNLLLTTYLSAKCPVYFAPAMDLDMYKHPSTKASLEKLSGFGNIFIKPGVGELASGLSGEGRMAEPEEILNFISSHLQSQLSLYNKKILITAGPTYESIDPVRFIGNRSSGKMGYALAEAALNLGAEVCLISGPTALQLSHPNLQIIQVESTQEMLDAVKSNFKNQDLAIAAAAVSDFTPVEVNAHKIKKSDQLLNINFKKTPDILSYMGKTKNQQVLIGFALETQDALKYARDKMKRKNTDAILVNTFSETNPVFGSDQNNLYFLSNKEQINLGQHSKQVLAQKIFQLITEKFL